jgi:hypothetical protein
MSSSGYAPLFSSLTTGTLCGKWPDIGLWAIVLSLKDRSGIVDVTPDYLSRVTGLDLQDVLSCMARFCEPDPYSRSSSEDGRRLVLIEPERRNWGWRVVNSGLYREKARLQNRDAFRTESGADAERKRLERDVSPDVPRSPPEIGVSPEVPLSEVEVKTVKRGRTKRASRVPDDFEPDLDYARSQISDIDAPREAQKFRDWEFKTPRSDWSAVWRNWIERCRESGKYAKQSERRFVC